MPLRLTRPMVGFRPTRPQTDDGLRIDPSVSLPTAAAHRLAATAAPEPELEPEQLRSSAYGLRVRPPRALQPLLLWLLRMLAHSLRLVLPRITAPAARSRCTTNASAWGSLPTSASEPAVVCMRSRVAMLSLIRIGMPCSGPRGPLAFNSASSACAIASASGFSSITLASAGPLRSMRWMRSV